MRRRHRLIALLALLGMLFQQVALAAYACPHERIDAAAMAMDNMPGCHETAAQDKARCAEHCHPQAAATDHAPTPVVPPAIVPPTTWVRTAARDALVRPLDRRSEVIARAAAPPVTIRHCTFQI